MKSNVWVYFSVSLNAQANVDAVLDALLAVEAHLKELMLASTSSITFLLLFVLY